MYEVKRSTIHGRGLFAAEHISAGTHLGSYQGPEAKRNSPYVLWYPDEDGTERGIVGRNALRFVNHSRKPNAEFRGPDLYATTEMGPGIEITVHYGPDYDEV